MATSTANKHPASAQVRLDSNEWESMMHAMRVLDLQSASEALREGLRLLRQEATKVEAGREIRAFHQGHPAPVPEGVPTLTQADLDAADASEW